MVGCWRNLDYLRCGVGMLAFNMRVTLHSSSQIDFLEGPSPPSRKRPPWWDILLTDDWKTSNVLCSQYRRLLNNAGIQHCKCSYIRTSGIDEAGF